MKVCVVTTGFPRWAGDGQCAFIWEAVRAITRAGVQVRVVAMHSPGVPRREFLEGVEIVRPRYWLPERWEMLRKAGPAGLPAAWKQYPLARIQIFPFALVHALVTAHCARGCDIVHAHWTLSAAAACLGRWIHRCPVVATVHGSDVYQVSRHPVGSEFTRNVLERCNRVTAVSRALMEAVITKGVTADKVQVVSNGVDVDLFAPSAEGRQDVILYVGSLIKRKGVEYLVAAMPGVLRAFPRYRLVLLGEGPTYTSLKSLAERQGIAGRVEFAGFQPSDQVRAWMQRARVLVLPSVEEAQGVVLLEAMACGLPIVASCVGGIPEVVTPDVGVLVPPADPRALATAIRAVLGDAGKWSRMSHNARERAVACYAWDRVADQFIALYETLRSEGERWAAA